MAGPQNAEALDEHAVVRGSVSVLGPDGRPVTTTMAFVPQDDNMLSTLTVEESVRYAALLRGIDPSQAAQRVYTVLCELGLDSVARSPIGAPGGSVRGISGGERRRCKRSNV